MLQATPVNAETAWREFRRSRFDKPPRFYYRPLAIDPTLLKRQLYLIPVERIDDPTLSYLFRQKQEELDRQITLLSDVDTPRFLPESLQIYGGVSDWLLAQAARTARPRADPRPRGIERRRSFRPPNSPSAPSRSWATTSSSAPILPPRSPCATTCTPA